MSHDQKVVQRIYGKLLSLYPRAFRERLGESMQQTFDDLYNERKQQTEQGLGGFVLWIFLETAAAIFRERLLLVTKGEIVQTVVRTTTLAALMSCLLILPFIVMEVVNRQNLNQDFPGMLFLVMWLNTFAIVLILLPIVLGNWTRNHPFTKPVSTQGNTLLSNPRSAALMSVVVILSPGILFLLDSLGWVSLEYLFNGSDPEQTYVPGQLLALASFSIPVAAGLIAGGPVARTLRAGGSLFAHRINLLIVIFILSAIALGLAGLIVDQWPCFIGVPNCD